MTNWMTYGEHPCLSCQHHWLVTGTEAFSAGKRQTRVWNNDSTNPHFTYIHEDNKIRQS